MPFDAIHSVQILYQALRLRLAPTMSLNNRSRISHASTSTCNQIGEKSGFARMDTEDLRIALGEHSARKTTELHAYE